VEESHCVVQPVIGHDERRIGEHTMQKLNEPAHSENEKRGTEEKAEPRPPFVMEMPLQEREQPWHPLAQAGQARMKKNPPGGRAQKMPAAIRPHHGNKEESRDGEQHHGAAQKKRKRMPSHDPPNRRSCSPAR